jgi:hypothetical protein
LVAAAHLGRLSNTCPFGTGARNGYADAALGSSKRRPFWKNSAPLRSRKSSPLQIKTAMKAKTLTKNKMAELMQTGRAQLDRLLDPEQGNVMAWTQMPTAGLGRRNAGQAI